MSYCYSWKSIYYYQQGEAKQSKKCVVKLKSDPAQICWQNYGTIGTSSPGITG